MIKSIVPILENLLLVWIISYRNLSESVRIQRLRNLYLHTISALHLYTLCEVLVKQFDEYVKFFLTKNISEIKYLQMYNESTKVINPEKRLSTTYLELGFFVQYITTIYRECIITVLSLTPTEEDCHKSSKYLTGKCGNYNNVHKMSTKSLENKQKRLYKETVEPVFDEENVISCSKRNVDNCSDNIQNNYTMYHIDHNTLEKYEDKLVCKPNEIKEVINTKRLSNEVLSAPNLVIDYKSLGLTQQICDDLVMLLTNQQYLMLSWSMGWPKLNTFHKIYSKDFDKLKMNINVLKFLSIYYSQLKAFQNNDQDEYYDNEQWADIDSDDISNYCSGASNSNINDLVLSNSECSFASKLPACSDDSNEKKSSSSKIETKKFEAVLKNNLQSQSYSLKLFRKQGITKFKNDVRNSAVEVIPYKVKILQTLKSLGSYQGIKALNSIVHATEGEKLISTCEVCGIATKNSIKQLYSGMEGNQETYSEIRDIVKNVIKKEIMKYIPGLKTFEHIIPPPSEQSINVVQVTLCKSSSNDTSIETPTSSAKGSSSSVSVSSSATFNATSSHDSPNQHSSVSDIVCSNRTNDNFHVENTKVDESDVCPAITSDTKKMSDNSNPVKEQEDSVGATTFEPSYKKVISGGNQVSCKPKNDFSIRLQVSDITNVSSQNLSTATTYPIDKVCFESPEQVGTMCLPNIEETSLGNRALSFLLKSRSKINLSSPQYFATTHSSAGRKVCYASQNSRSKKFTQVPVISSDALKMNPPDIMKSAFPSSFTNNQFLHKLSTVPVGSSSDPFTQSSDNNLSSIKCDSLISDKNCDGKKSSIPNKTKVITASNLEIDSDITVDETQNLTGNLNGMSSGSLINPRIQSTDQTVVQRNYVNSSLFSSLASQSQKTVSGIKGIDSNILSGLVTANSKFHVGSTNINQDVLQLIQNNTSKIQGKAVCSFGLKNAYTKHPSYSKHNQSNISKEDNPVKFPSYKIQAHTSKQSAFQNAALPKFQHAFGKSIYSQGNASSDTSSMLLHSDLCVDTAEEEEDHNVPEGNMSPKETVNPSQSIEPPPSSTLLSKAVQTGEIITRNSVQTTTEHTGAVNVQVQAELGILDPKVAEDKPVKPKEIKMFPSHSVYIPSRIAYNISPEITNVNNSNSMARIGMLKSVRELIPQRKAALAKASLPLILLPDSLQHSNIPANSTAACIITPKVQALMKEILNRRNTFISEPPSNQAKVNSEPLPVTDIAARLAESKTVMPDKTYTNGSSRTLSGSSTATFVPRLTIPVVQKIAISNNIGEREISKCAINICDDDGVSSDDDDLSASESCILDSEITNNDCPLHSTTASSSISTSVRSTVFAHNGNASKIIGTHSPLQSTVSSSTLEQLREFESVLEQVTNTSQLKERKSNNINHPRTDSESHTPLSHQILLSRTSSPSSCSSSSSQNNEYIPSTTPSSFSQAILSVSSAPSSPVSPKNKIVMNNISTVNTNVTSSTSNKISSPPLIIVTTYCQPVLSPALDVISKRPCSPSVTPSQPSFSANKVLRTSKSSKSKSPKSNVSITTSKSPTPKPQQKSQEDEETAQRIYAILNEYKELVRVSPEQNNKPAPRRRSNPPTNPSHSSKRKKSQSKGKVAGQQPSASPDMSPGTDDPRSEDSSSGLTPISHIHDSPLSVQGSSESHIVKDTHTTDIPSETGVLRTSDSNEISESQQSELIFADTNSIQRKTLFIEDIAQPSADTTVSSSSSVVTGKPVVVGSATVPLYIPGGVRQVFLPVAPNLTSPIQGYPVVVSKGSKVIRLHQVTVPSGSLQMNSNTSTVPGAALVVRQMCVNKHGASVAGTPVSIFSQSTLKPVQLPVTGISTKTVCSQQPVIFSSKTRPLSSSLLASSLPHVHPFSNLKHDISLNDIRNADHENKNVSESHSGMCIETKDDLTPQTKIDSENIPAEKRIKLSFMSSVAQSNINDTDKKPFLVDQHDFENHFTSHIVTESDYKQKSGGETLQFIGISNSQKLSDAGKDINRLKRKSDFDLCSSLLFKKHNTDNSHFLTEKYGENTKTLFIKSENKWMKGAPVELIQFGGENSVPDLQTTEVKLSTNQLQHQSLPPATPEVTQDKEFTVSSDVFTENILFLRDQSKSEKKRLVENKNLISHEKELSVASVPQESNSNTFKSTFPTSIENNSKTAAWTPKFQHKSLVIEDNEKDVSSSNEGFVNTEIFSVEQEQTENKETPWRYTPAERVERPSFLQSNISGKTSSRNSPNSNLQFSHRDRIIKSMSPPSASRTFQFSAYFQRKKENSENSKPIVYKKDESSFPLPHSVESICESQSLDGVKTSETKDSDMEKPIICKDKSSLDLSQSQVYQKTATKGTDQVSGTEIDVSQKQNSFDSITQSVICDNNKFVSDSLPKSYVFRRDDLNVRKYDGNVLKNLKHINFANKVYTRKGASGGQLNREKNKFESSLKIPYYTKINDSIEMKNTSGGNLSATFSSGKKMSCVSYDVVGNHKINKDDEIAKNKATNITYNTSRKIRKDDELFVKEKYVGECDKKDSIISLTKYITSHKCTVGRKSSLSTSTLNENEDLMIDTFSNSTINVTSHESPAPAASTIYPQCLRPTEETVDHEKKLPLLTTAQKYTYTYAKKTSQSRQMISKAARRTKLNKPYQYGNDDMDVEEYNKVILPEGISDSDLCSIKSEVLSHEESTSVIPSSESFTSNSFSGAHCEKPDSSKLVNKCIKTVHKISVITENEDLINKGKSRMKERFSESVSLEPVSLKHLSTGEDFPANNSETAKSESCFPKVKRFKTTPSKLMDRAQPLEYSSLFDIISKKVTDINKPEICSSAKAVSNLETYEFEDTDSVEQVESIFSSRLHRSEKEPTITDIDCDVQQRTFRSLKRSYLQDYEKQWRSQEHLKQKKCFGKSDKEMSKSEENFRRSVTRNR